MTHAWDPYKFNEMEVEELIVGHYYEITAQGGHTQRSVTGRYRGTMKLRGYKVYWFSTDAFEVMVEPEYLVNLKDLGKLYGRNI